MVKQEECNMHEDISVSEQRVERLSVRLWGIRYLYDVSMQAGGPAASECQAALCRAMPLPSSPCFPRRCSEVPFSAHPSCWCQRGGTWLVLQFPGTGLVPSANAEAEADFIGALCYKGWPETMVLHPVSCECENQEKAEGCRGKCNTLLGLICQGVKEALLLTCLA